MVKGSVKVEAAVKRASVAAAGAVWSQVLGMHGLSSAVRSAVVWVVGQAQLHAVPK